MRNQKMTELCPLGTREEGHEIAFDLLRIFMLGQAETSGDPADVGVDHHAACDAKGIAQNDVRRLASHARQRHQLVQRRVQTLPCGASRAAA